MKNYQAISSATKTSFLVILCTLASFCLFGIQLQIFGQFAANFILMEPIINGFLHTGFSHFAYNITGFFLLLLPLVNQPYEIRKIFKITFFISLIYLPIALLGIYQPAIGLSGTVYFLLTRWLLSWEKQRFGLIILGFIIIGEASQLFQPDNIAHGVHLIGVSLGYVSLNEKHRKYNMISWLWI